MGYDDERRVDPNIEVDDSLDFSSRKDATITIKDIVLRQIKMMGDICSKELTGSYWEKKPVKMSDGVFMIEIYHEDLKEAYCNCVDFIIDLVYPEANATLKGEIEAHETIVENIEDTPKRLVEKKKIFRKMNIFFNKSGYFNMDKRQRVVSL